MGQTQSVDFPYEVGEVVASYRGKSNWTLHAGIRKSDGLAVSIFAFDVKANQSKLATAKNNLKRFKTLRHPNILAYMDGVELDTNIYIVTEEVTPLDDVINDLQEFPSAVSWGLYCLTKAVSFLNNDCNLVHGAITTSAVFVNKAGDWKLGGLDLVSDLNDPNFVLKNEVETIPSKYRTPEVSKAAWSVVQSSGSYVVDVWMLGCLIYEIHNPGQFSAQEDVKKLANIPKALQPQYKQLFTSAPKQRLPPNKLLESPYFATPYVETCLFLENINIKDTFDKDNFFKKLPKLLDQFPASACKYKILPHLITALDFGAASSRALESLLRIGSQLTEQEYNTLITPNVAKWFNSPDKELRLHLLQNLQAFIQHLPNNLVSDSIFPSVSGGFMDPNPAVRELTVKSMLLLAPKLNEKIIEQQLIRFFAKLQVDPEPGIRANTTICLGKISDYLPAASRDKLLVSAMLRAMSDSFGAARSAGLMALAATQQCYTLQDTATKIIPAISHLLIDPDKQVRTTAFQSIKTFIKKLETISEASPDTPVAAPQTAAAPGADGGASVGMLGWAFSSISKKIYGADEKGAGATSPATATSPPTTSPMTSNTSSPVSSPTPPRSFAAEKSKPTTTAPATTGFGATSGSGFGAKSDSFGSQQQNKGDDGWDAYEDFDKPEKPKKKTIVATKTAKTDSWDEDFDSIASKPKPAATKPKEEPSKPKSDSGWDEFEDFDMAPKAVATAPKVAPKLTSTSSSGMQLGKKASPSLTSKSSSPPQSPPAQSRSLAADMAPSSTSGWGDDDADLDAWDDFDKPAKPAKLATSPPADGGKKLTKLEMAQLRKEERLKKKAEATK